jgi:tetratricopeptide (TPR) repeat protein
VTGRTRALTVVLALAGVSLAAGVLHAREMAYPVAPVTDRLLYLRSGKTADRLMLDFDALAADIYWIRSIQSYGRDLKNRNQPDRFALVGPLLDLTTTLDPHFLIAYRFGSIFLAFEPPNGPGRTDLAIQLLEKGLAADPTRWQLAHDIGFVHYFHTRDYATAAEWFERAAAMPNAPSWIGPFAAITKAGGGNRSGARQILRGLAVSQEDYVRRMAERSLQQLDALDSIDQLEGIVQRFNEIHGRYPSGWQDLIADRALTGIPADKQSVPFVYDAASHRVALAPESPLMPLPEMLRR